MNKSNACASLIYRLRSQGYRIDTRKRSILISEHMLGCDIKTPMVRKLINVYGFTVQTMLDDTVSSRVYISGPIAHYDLEERRQTFKEAEKRLRANGYLPVNPMNNGLPQPGDWRMHMLADMKMLLKCQYIYFLPDWELSKGCKLELDVATSCGIKVLHF